MISPLTLDESVGGTTSKRATLTGGPSRVRILLRVVRRLIANLDNKCGYPERALSRLRSARSISSQRGEA